MMLQFITDELISTVNSYRDTKSLPFYRCIQLYLEDKGQITLPYISLNTDLKNYLGTFEKAGGLKGGGAPPCFKVAGGSKGAAIPPLGVPLLKLQQICDLSQVISQCFPDSFNSVTELCCGKAYLGLTVAGKLHIGQFTGYDVNRHLVGRLATYASQRGYRGKIIGIERDLLRETVIFTENSLTVALHACGELTDKILGDFVASERGRRVGLVLVPCCYHKHRTGDKLRWMSQRYKQLGIDVNIDFLQHLTTQARGSPDQQAKTTAQCSRKRYLKIVTNLVIACLRSIGTVDLSHLDKYTDRAYVSIPDRCLGNINRPIVEVVDSVFAHPYFNITADWQSQVRLEQVASRAKTIMDNIKHFELSCLEPLKRLVELMILEDRQLYLSEHGHNARLIPFTCGEVTPRNIAIVVT